MRIFIKENIELIKDNIRGSLIPFISRVKLNAWDMDATATKTFTFGSDLGFKNIQASSIFFCFIVIFGDDGSYWVSMKDIYFSWDSTTFTITRVASGLFDNTNFDSTSINRGYLFLIKY